MPGSTFRAFFEGAVKRHELAGRAHFVDRFVDGRHRPGAFDGNGVRRQADAARSASSSSLAATALVDDGRLLPL
jgi:hypothetical protein